VSRLKLRVAPGAKQSGWKGYDANAKPYTYGYTIANTCAVEHANCYVSSCAYKHSYTD